MKLRKFNEINEKIKKKEKVDSYKLAWQRQTNDPIEKPTRDINRQFKDEEIFFFTFFTQSVFYLHFFYG